MPHFILAVLVTLSVKAQLMRTFRELSLQKASAKGTCLVPWQVSVGNLINSSKMALAGRVVVFYVCKKLPQDMEGLEALQWSISWSQGGRFH
jgi:hypothetical protein